MVSTASKVFCLLRARLAAAAMGLKDLAGTSQPLLPWTQAGHQEISVKLHRILGNQEVAGLWRRSVPQGLGLPTRGFSLGTPDSP